VLQYIYASYNFFVDPGSNQTFQNIIKRCDQRSV